MVEVSISLLAGGAGGLMGFSLKVSCCRRRLAGGAVACNERCPRWAARACSFRWPTRPGRPSGAPRLAAGSLRRPSSGSFLGDFLCGFLGGLLCDLLRGFLG